MKKEILSEEINAIKYLLGYKRGVVISEQQAPQLGSIQPSNKSTANMFKDSLAATQGLGTNNKSPQDIYNDFQKQNSPTAQIYQDFQSKYGQQAQVPATGTPAAAAPATGTPAAAAPATGTPAAAAPATNLSVPDLIKQVQTVLKTKFKANLGTSGPNKDGVDGVWGKNTQAALESAIKTLPAAAPTTGTPAAPTTGTPAAAAPTTGTPAAAAPTTGTPAAAPPTTQFKAGTIPDFKGFTPSTPKLT
jgi:hypothetical protein